MDAGKQTVIAGAVLFRAETSPAQGGLELTLILLPLCWACVTRLCWLGFLTRQGNVSTIQSVTLTL